MKDRLLTLLLALAALGAFYVLLVPKRSAPQAEVTRPLTSESGPNGYLAAQRWLEAAGIETRVLRERYTRLGALTGDRERGHLLITTAPHAYPMRHEEIGALQDWIAAGNTLLVLAGLSDTPDWSMVARADRDLLRSLRHMTGLHFSPAPVNRASGGDDASAAVIAADRPYPEPRRFELVPNGPHPLFAGVRSVRALSEYPANEWRAQPANVEIVLELAQNPESGEPVMWLARYANGRIVVSGYGSVFTNELLGEADNAQLFANLVQWGRASHGWVIFDDAHQGSVAFYDPAAFFGDWRLYATLLWLLALWLAFVLGPQRLRRRAANWQPVDTTAFVRATGRFLARVVKPTAAANRMFAHFFDEVHTRLGVPRDGASIWERLRARGDAPEDDLTRLEALHARAVHGRRIDLRELHNLLLRTRRTLI